MIVVGIDPGGKDTGLVVIDDNRLPLEALLASSTIRRETDRLPLEVVPRGYTLDVISAVLVAVLEFDAELIAVEGVVKPSGHAAGRGGHLINPAGLLATAQIVGAIMGRAWSVPVVRVAPGQNGTFLPFGQYPEPIRGTRAGKDNRRHMRSAFDVAMQGRPTHRLERLTR